MPEDVRSAEGLARCGFCPVKTRGGLCDSIRPLRATFYAIDNCASFDPAIAVYPEKDFGLLTWLRPP